MLNKIWAIFIIVSVLFSICTGNIDSLNSSIFESASSAVNMTLTFFATICLWSGIIKVLQETKIMKILTKIISPVMRLLFPKIKKEEQAYKQISINLIANMLGLGNAATPLGLAAMQSMQEKNTKKDVLTDEMMMFIILNTASLQIIPSTVIAIRVSLNSKNPTSIILPVWCATITAGVTGIIATKILLKHFKIKEQ